MSKGSRMKHRAKADVLSNGKSNSSVKNNGSVQVADSSLPVEKSSNDTTSNETSIQSHEKLPEDDKIIEKSSVGGSKWTKVLSGLDHIFFPILITALGSYLRYFNLGANKNVVWDEAHFAKFGAYYVRHEFYHDVHPPLGKMLIGLSEYLSNSSNTEFMFESGQKYPEDIHIEQMRLFQVCFSALQVLVCYFTANEIGFKNRATVWLVSIMCCLENSFIVMSKFVLLDSMLLFFTATTFFCLIKIHNLRKEEFTLKWKLWMYLTGLSIGCVCSVKWVGLFVTALVGVYTILDLWLKFWDIKIFTWKSYTRAWTTRILNFIIVPAMVYLICFKIHFTLLYKPGTGSSSMSTLFQANLLETDILPQSRYVAIGSEVTIRSQGGNPNLLHSHVQIYPEGSHQHQITTYGHKDTNNNWHIKESRTHFEYDDKYVKDGDLIRLQHVLTKSNLHSHRIHAHVSKNQWEASGYGNDEIGDDKDDWWVEIVSQAKSSNSTYSKLYEHGDGFTNYVHPISTSFRLKHKVLGCYLATTGKSYPSWGFKQGEVVCMNAGLSKYFSKDTLWNIESHENKDIPVDTDYEFPDSSFFDDFFAIQKSMMASNNGLVPDQYKKDDIASLWWQWPILDEGIRMCSWGPQNTRYYLLGSPFNVWLTTFLFIPLAGCLFYLSVLYQRQRLVVNEQDNWYLFICGICPLLGWIFHYLPFIVMARVTYHHHYMPALYFAIFLGGFAIELMTSRMKRYIISAVYLTLLVGAVVVFYYSSPLCLGMTGALKNYRYLKWMKSWNIA